MIGELLTAICFFAEKEKKTPLKYRNIKSVVNFEKFAKEKGVGYINYYSKNTKEFLTRKYL